MSTTTADGFAAVTTSSIRASGSRGVNAGWPHARCVSLSMSTIVTGIAPSGVYQPWATARSARSNLTGASAKKSAAEYCRTVPSSAKHAATMTASVVARIER